MACFVIGFLNVACSITGFLNVSYSVIGFLKMSCFVIGFPKVAYCRWFSKLRGLFHHWFSERGLFCPW